MTHHLRQMLPNQHLYAVADFREGNSVCPYCASLGSLAIHAAVRDPNWSLMTCRGCGACIWMSRTEVERLQALKDSVLADRSRRVILTSGAHIPKPSGRDAE